MDSEPNPPGYIEIICGTLGLITLFPAIFLFAWKNGFHLAWWKKTHIPELTLFVLPIIFFSISHIFRKRRTQPPKH